MPGMDTEIPKPTVADEAGGVLHCGECDACRLRLKGFREVGIEDPVPYTNLHK